ncbi:hypothetical protein [Paenibacillus sp. BR1-192]|uniref:hypothetical protein n=1 Tax=Paenibacillus sp. BR1-192 TaxID=3032287 RepID=UPI00240E6480|nr:hypothetical protein [Paenibacillus sp. BR1-192]WFB61561.1 hypothetical protein P0X86_15680 [Paenibacillus sp. BR1-192]
MLATKQSNQTNMNLDIQLAPEGEFYSVTGEGTILLNGKESNVVLTKSLISKATLKNGNTYLYGPLDADLIHKSGETEPIIIGIGAIAETGQRYFTLTLGNFGEEIQYFVFGDGDFINEEIMEIQTENSGG